MNRPTAAYALPRAHYGKEGREKTGSLAMAEARAERREPGNGPRTETDQVVLKAVHEVGARADKALKAAKAAQKAAEKALAKAEKVAETVKGNKDTLRDAVKTAEKALKTAEKALNRA